MGKTKAILDNFYTCDFEILGSLKNSFFRKYTEEQAKLLNLTGWCKETNRGTIRGQLQGSPDKLTAMQKWISSVSGSQSRIERCRMSDLHFNKNLKFQDFEVIIPQHEDFKMSKLTKEYMSSDWRRL